MNDATASLLEALGAVNQRVPDVIRALAIGDMLPLKQHQFAGLLIQLGELLHRHADSRLPATDGGRQVASEGDLLSAEDDG
ncbi:hypothetical protein [Amycolatopsis minnesotensis]|uniref:Uncharacterized protein n=1 Tax=Amycolatopsis minnesotensis TaxID=337894 RepID=A0ABN2RU00_9PSEU